MVLSVLHSGRNLHKMNYTHIVLIPKKKDPQLITECPISLGNVVSRIISKVLANRVKPVLSRVISDSKVHSCLTVGHMAIKLDVSKAYNRMEWEFLEKIMLRIGFPE